MASKQVIDVIRRKRRRQNTIRQELKYDKKFRWMMRRPISDGYTIEIPADGFDQTRLAALDVPDDFESKPLDPSIKGTYTTPSGETKDIRDLPTFMDLLNEAQAQHDAFPRPAK